MLGGKGHKRWEKFLRLHEKDTAFSRYYEDILKNIFLNEDNTDKRTFLITSAVESEGKTTVSVSIAVTLARQGKRTLLIDANFTNPMIESVLGVKGAPGLTNIFNDNTSKEDVIIQDKHIPDLYFLPGGTSKEGFLDVLLLGKSNTFLNEFKTSYDYVIIDSSSTAKSLDPIILGRHVDGVVQVVLCDKTKKDDVKNAKLKIERNKGKIVGLVLNKVPKYIPSFYRKI